jgi:hypothetical protein
VQAIGASERERRSGGDGAGESKLGLLDGRGSLTLVRDGAGAIVRGSGSWRPTNGELDYEDLCELLRPGAALVYKGPARDEAADAGGWIAVELEVEITSVERCAAESDGAGSPGGLVRLEVRGNAGSVWEPPPPEV